MKNENYFDIFECINKNLEEEDISGQVIVSLNEDCNKEPYIEITYIDELGDKASFVSDYENLSGMYDYVSKFTEVFDVPEDSSVTSIVYDTYTEQLNLVRVMGNDYIGNKFSDDYEGSAIFVGYIINKKLNLNYEEKLNILYNVIKEIMESSFQNDYELQFVFNAKDEFLENIYSVKDWKDGSLENDEEEREESNNKNLSVIEGVFNVNLNSQQKTKKL